MMKYALVALVALVAVTEAFAPPSTTLSTARSVRVAASAPKMEAWSEKNIRFTLLAGIGLPILGVVTPPDNTLAAFSLPLAIAAVWIYIFVDLLKAAAPAE
ncbi:hypothetical protein CTAYLR_004619 [Chrysophaeum taylorii]|uniref:Uncharacterized protein n=1 Tax=Chrysophaeum taylorii TaxID=2483200 RepID=A0AAD7XQL1_9STRA|nr:hypothetical protein CTAYLR_004619 [Chrysophaeum taylorii]